MVGGQSSVASKTRASRKVWLFKVMEAETQTLIAEMRSYVTVDENKVVLEKSA